MHAAEAWWFLRSFVLREDLSLDYDVGGLGVSATFLIVLVSFVVAIAQVWYLGGRRFVPHVLSELSELSAHNRQDHGRGGGGRDVVNCVGIYHPELRLSLSR